MSSSMNNTALSGHSQGGRPSSTPVDLLKSITRDPNYVKKLQDGGNDGGAGGGGGSSSFGRNWDNRFTMNKIPQYDAVNDRFCKFNLRKRGTKNAPKRSMLPGGVLPGGPVGAVAGGKPAWGVKAEGYQPMSREHGGGPLPPVKTGTPPELAGGVGALTNTMPTTGGPGQPDSRVGTADPAALGLIPQGQSLESVWTKSKQRIIKLWDELGVSEADRLAFAQHAMVTPSGESVALMNEEIQRLLDRRNAAVAVEKAIEVREGFLYLLQELSERFSTTAMEKERALRELNALIVPFRNASLDSVDAILRWREVQRSPAPYLWKGVSYLHKMASDIFFLTFSRIGQLLDFDLKNNPLLDPRKELDNTQAGAQGGKLPPIRRAKDNQRLKDLPRERMERAERAMLEEVQRQQQLSMTRASGSPTGPVDASGVPTGPQANSYVEEEAHLANLVREDQEKNQILVEEDAWLTAHQQQQQEKDAEERASIKIQTAWRGFFARRLVKAKIIQRISAIKMQTLARQFIAKIYVGRLRQQMRAAKKIQALHRGVNTRSTIQEVRHRHTCAIQIQRLFRGHMARKIAEMLKYIRSNAITIQRVYRGHRVRKAVRHFLKVERDEYAIVIQKHWRGYLVRRNPSNDPRKVEKVVKLQAWARGNMDRDFAKQLLIARRAAIRLQAWWRKCSAKLLVDKIQRAKIDRGWEHRLHIAVLAVTKIQSIFRQFKAKKRCNALRLDRENTLAAEATRLMEEEERQLQQFEIEKNDKAAKIQALARGAEARRQAKMIRELNSCATEIQRVVRGRLGRNRAHDRHLEHIQELTEMSVTPSDAVPSLIETTLLQMAAKTAENTPEKAEPASFATPQAGDAASPLLEDNETTIQQEQKKDVVPSEEETAAPVTENPSMGEVSQIHTEEDTSSEPPQEEISPVSASTAQAEENSSSKNEVPPSSGITSQLDGAQAAPAAEQVQDQEQKPAPEIDAVATAVVSIGAEINRSSEVVDPKQQAVTRIVRFMRFVKAKRAVERARRLNARGFNSRETHNQETLYSVRILQNWFQSRLLRLHFVHNRSIKRAHDLHGRKERRQEENFAAGLIQVAAKNFITRRRAKNTTTDLQRRREIVSQRQALDQELQAAASIIQICFRGAMSRASAKAVAGPKPDHSSTATSLEMEYAARMIQISARRKIANLQLQKARSEQNTADFASEVQASAQAIEFATLKIQGAARVSSSRASVAEKRQVRQSKQKADELAAVEQEEIFASFSKKEEEAEESKQHLALPSALNVNHARRGSHDVHVDFNAQAVEAAESHAHHDLPKDADLAVTAIQAPQPEEEEKLIQRIKALENQLADAERRRVEVDEEVARRVEEEVVKRVSASPARQSHDNETPAPPLEATEENITEPATPSDAGVASPGVQTPPPAPVVGSSKNEEEMTTATTQHVSPPSAESDPSTQIEEKVAEAAAPVEVIATPSPSTAQEEETKAETSSPAMTRDEAIGRVQAVFRARDAVEAVNKKLISTTTSPVAEEKNGEERQQSEIVSSPVEESTAVVASKQDEDAAAARIQAIARSTAAKKALEQKKQELREKEAAEVAEAAAAQKAYEEKQLRQKSEKNAAVQIQCSTRQFLARKKVDARRVEVEAERAEKQRQTQLEIAEKEAEDARLLAIKDADEKFEKDTRAACIIQRAYRCYNARFMLSWKKQERKEKRAKAKLDEEDNNTSAAAIKIQCFFRKAIARRRVRDRKKEKAREHLRSKEFEQKRHNAAIKIQCAYRCYNARFELKCRRDRKYKQEQAVAEEKRLMEQRILDKIAREEEEKLQAESDSKAALTMQLAWRSYNARFRKTELERQKLESEEQKILFDHTSRIQAVGRAYFDRKILTKFFAKVLNARVEEEKAQADRENLASVAQPVGRGYMTRLNAATHQSVDGVAGSAIESALRESSQSPNGEEREEKSSDNQQEQEGQQVQEKFPEETTAADAPVAAPSEKEEQEKEEETGPQVRTLIINKASNLVDRDGFGSGESDVFVLVFNEAGEEVLRTTVKNNTLNPTWKPENSTVQLQLTPAVVSTSSIRLEVWNHNSITSNDFQGCITIPKEKFLGMSGEQTVQLTPRTEEEDEFVKENAAKLGSLTFTVSE